MPETYTLKQLRGVNGMTQDEVAEKLEVSKFTWANWESGKTAPDFWQLQKIKILRKTIALPTSLARPAISWCSKVTKSTTLSMALFVVSAISIPIKVINIKALFVRVVSIKIITGNKIRVITNSILKDFSVFIKSTNPFNA